MLAKLVRHFGVQSKLISLVLVASLVSLLLTGLLSFGVARHLLSEAGQERLTSVRNARADAVAEYLEQLSDQVITLSETRMTIDAIQRYSQAFKQLPDINPEQKKQLRSYYEQVYIPKLRSVIAGEPSASTYFPATPAERYLKFNYSAKRATTAPKSEDLSGQTVAAADNSAWGAVHKEYHRRFARQAKLFGYQDVLMVDIKTGDVVSNVSGEDDLGTNFLSGPYSDSVAAGIFRQVRSSRDPFFRIFSDFENYKPSLGAPTFFVGTNVFADGKLVGALIFQISTQRIDTLMTSSRQWREVGMGSSGEAYLVGSDGTFRSSPRPFLEDPKRYLAIAKRNGLSQAKVDAIQRSGTPVLIQPVRTLGARSALAGKTGTDSYTDYRGGACCRILSANSVWSIPLGTSRQD